MEMEQTLQSYMNRHLPLKEVVFCTMREAILQGELSPGERLMEIHLADKLGVSRTPIREALRMLEKDGLVCIIPRRGAIVAGITEKQMQNVLEVRHALEELAAELAAERITPKQLEKVTEASQAFEKCIRSKDANALAKADEKFHYLITDSTDNSNLIQFLADFREQMYRYRVAYLRKEELYPELLKEHQLILDCLIKHDPAGARKAVRVHIDRQQQIMLDQVIIAAN